MKPMNDCGPTYKINSIHKSTYMSLVHGHDPRCIALTEKFYKSLIIVMGSGGLEGFSLGHRILRPSSCLFEVTASFCFSFPDLAKS